MELSKELPDDCIDLVVTSPPYADTVSYGKDIKWIKPKVKKYKPKSWKVKDYTVSFNGSFYSCTCLGYIYRHKCKHITKVSESFRPSRGRAGAGVV